MGAATQNAMSAKRRGIVASSAFARVNTRAESRTRKMAKPATATEGMPQPPESTITPCMIRRARKKDRSTFVILLIFNPNVAGDAARTDAKRLLVLASTCLVGRPHFLVVFVSSNELKVCCQFVCRVGKLDCGVRADCEIWGVRRLIAQSTEVTQH